MMSSSSPSKSSDDMERPPWLRYSKQELSITKAGNFPPLRRHPPHGPYDDYVHTRCLVEVFQVRIDKFDEVERRGELYGKIRVVDMKGTRTLYQRDRSNPEHVWANCNITLTGPPRTISVLVGFTINVDLHLCSDSKDVALSRWQLSWDAMNPQVSHIARGHFLPDFCLEPKMLSSSMLHCKHQSAGYDQPLSATLEGPNNSCITLYYAILKHGVQAQVVVEIIDTQGVPTLAEYDVRGTIHASYGHFECGGDDSYNKDDYKATLFKTTTLESVKAKRWMSLQLSRCVVAVPAYSSLVIEANLWDTTSLLKIAQGKVEFESQGFGIGVDYIKGDVDANIAIRVRVDWLFGSKIPKYRP